MAQETMGSPILVQDVVVMPVRPVEPRLLLP